MSKRYNTYLFLLLYRVIFNTVFTKCEGMVKRILEFCRSELNLSRYSVESQQVNAKRLYIISLYNKLPNTAVFVLTITSAIFFSLSCAKQVGLTGGPVDTDPPVILGMHPENASVNFSESEIIVNFDEYIRLNNLNQKLIISPPMETKPDISIRGKSLRIRIKPEELEPNTTYCLNFNDAIADNNENNALHSFIYAFSTGDYIDSLTVSGKVLDAYTKQPVKDAFVLLHNNLADTAFRTVKPVYLSKVNERGEFKIPFLKEGDYHIFALVDANFNFKFDVAEEKIAFLDSIIRPGVEITYKEVFATPENEEDDGLKTIEKEIVRFVPDNISLLLFEEDHQRQYFKDRERLNRNKIQLIFNRQQYHGFEISVVNDEDPILIHNENPDTINIWLQNPELIASDTVFIHARYYSPIDKDSLIFDTIRVTKTEIPEYKDSVLIISGSDKKHPAKEYKLRFSTPVKDFDISYSQFGIFEDSVFTPFPHNFRIDSTNPQQMILEADFQKDMSYSLIFREGFANSIYMLANVADTLQFKQISEETFGHLSISIPDKTGNYVLQLLKGDRIIYDAIPADGIADFKFLKPDNYKMQLIFDENKNGRWDTGNYDKKIQPEKIIFYPGEIEIRANWSHEIDWDFLNDDSSTDKDE